MPRSPQDGATRCPRVPSPQLRKMSRVRCSFPVTCRVHGREAVITVRDMGLEGMRLEMPARVEPGHVLALTYDSPLSCFAYATVRVRVVWSHQRESSSLHDTGVAYLEGDSVIEQSWVRHLLRVFDLDHVSARERREDIRVPMVFPGRVVACGKAQGPGEVLQGSIHDLGIGGALFESPVELPLGEAVSIDIGPMGDGSVLSCDGRVVRRAGMAAGGHPLLGIRFDGPRDRTYEAVEPHLSRVLYGAH